MDKIDLLINEMGAHRVKYNEPLEYYLFRKDKVSAQFFYIATNQRELERVLDLCFKLKISFLIFGNGTKIIFDKSKLNKLVIRNRAAGIKIVGIKGKMGKGNLGVEGAKMEIDSGVTVQALNEYLTRQGLAPPIWQSSVNGTIGGSLLVDSLMLERCEKLKIWKRGEIDEILPQELQSKDVVLSAVMNFKSAV